MSSVALTRPEAQWISRSVLKTLTILEAAAEKDPAMLKRRTFILLDQLRAQASQMAKDLDEGKQEGLYVTVTASQRKMLTALIDATVKSLTEVVIPVYVQKNQLDYANATQVKIDMIQAMKRRIR